MHRLVLALGLTTLAMSTDAATLRYHGELLDRNAPANARYDLRLTPYADAGGKQVLASAVTFEDVLVEDGFFLLEPDFGAGIHDSRDVWIELAVRDADSTLNFATIEGRQKAALAPLVGQCWSTTGDSGVIPSTNFLGTTDGAPLVLRSSSGIGINTSDPRDLLTLRGPDSYLDGPTINLSGSASDQAESGRIRFVEGTATGNFRGAYIRYDGTNNEFAIGAHNNSDALPASDVDQIVMLRSATTRVGIGRTPGEELDVQGDIRINGGVKYAQLLNHKKVFVGASLHELGGNDCRSSGGFDIRRNSILATCFASVPVDLPRAAKLVRLEGQFNDTDANEDCTFKLTRIVPGPDGVTSPIIASVTSVGSGGNQVRVNSFDSNLSADDGLVLSFSSAGNCSGGYAEVTYQLPAGFVP